MSADECKTLKLIQENVQWEMKLELNKKTFHILRKS
jgi:hypothetical protein